MGGGGGGGCSKLKSLIWGVSKPHKIAFLAQNDQDCIVQLDLGKTVKGSLKCDVQNV